MASSTRRNQGLSRISRVTRWSAAGAVLATAGISVAVADAQPGRAPSSGSTGASVTAANTDPAEIAPTVPPTTAASRRRSTTPSTVPAPVPAPTRHRQQPPVTSGGS